MPRAAFAFSHRIRVRYSEVDPQRVVFNARYLDYADIAVTEYWRAVGVSFSGPEPLEFHVAHARVDYRAPIFADEEVDLLARTGRVGRTSMTTLIEIHGTGAENLRAEVELVQVHVALATHRPAPLPDWLGARFLAFDKHADA